MSHIDHILKHGEDELCVSPAAPGLIEVHFERQGEGGPLVLAKAGKAKAKDDEDAKRRELVERSRGGEQIELLLHAKTYEQIEGQPDASFVDFSPRALKQLKQTAKDTPFLRDHATWNIEACGGLCESAELVGVPGGKALHEKIVLDQPWAVQAALTRKMRKFSIGWFPTGKVLCLLCKKSVRECRHWPGQLIGEGDSPKRVVWRYTSVRKRETSHVLFPAVRTTEPLSIEQLSGRSRHFVPTGPGGQMNEELCKLARLLGLDPAAGLASVEAAVQKALADRDEYQAGLADHRKRLEASETELSELRAKDAAREQATRDAECERTVTELRDSGFLIGGRESKREALLRQAFASNDPDLGRQLAESFREGGRVTLAGQPRQSRPEAEPAPTSRPGDAFSFPRKDDRSVDYVNLREQLPVGMREQLSSGWMGDDPEAAMRGNWAQIAQAMGWPETIPEVS